MDRVEQFVIPFNDAISPKRPETTEILNKRNGVGIFRSCLGFRIKVRLKIRTVVEWEIRNTLRR